MKYDLQQLLAAFRTSYEFELDNSIEGVTILRFKDSRLRYELHLVEPENNVILAADPSEPIQPCPMLEYGFPCTQIDVGISAYDVSRQQPAIRFHDGQYSQSNQRLTMTWVDDGDYWYLWASGINSSSE